MTHRPKLNSRKKVVDFVRTFQTADSGNYLRAFFVDEDCTFLQSAILASSNEQILRVNARELLHQASIASAAGIILARGIGAATTHIEEAERLKAKQLQAVAEDLGIYLLDYIIVAGSIEQGVFAIKPSDRWFDHD